MIFFVEMGVLLVLLVGGMVFCAMSRIGKFIDVYGDIYRFGFDVRSAGFFSEVGSGQGRAWKKTWQA